MTETSTVLALRAPAAMADKVEYCKLLADSGLLPDSYRRQPANVLYAIEYAETIGVPPMAAITGVHVIKGKPSASAALISGLVRRAGHKLRVRGDDRKAVAIIVRSDDPDFEFRSEWTIERGVTAGLCAWKDGVPFARDKDGKPTAWEKYPAAMLKARAITEVARDACEEVLFGLHYTPEEAGADVDEDGIPIAQVLDAVERKAEREQPAPPPRRDPWTDNGAPLPDEPRPSTHGQRTKLAILCDEKRGATDRDTRLAVVSEVVGRPIRSSTDLSFAEAHQAINALSAEPDHIPDAEIVPEPSAPNPRNGDVPVSAQVEAALSSPLPGVQPDGWSHRMATDRGAPLATRADGSDQMFEDMAIAIADATDTGELEGLYLAAKHAHELGKLTDEQFAKLDQLGFAQNEDLRTRAGASA